jgi:hypothetical protein
MHRIAFGDSTNAVNAVEEPVAFLHAVQEFLHLVQIQATLFCPGSEHEEESRCRDTELP